jgi:hypothetical protein
VHHEWKLEERVDWAEQKAKGLQQMSDSRDRQEYEREIELIDYIEVLLKRKKLIILGTLTKGCCCR